MNRDTNPSFPPLLLSSPFVPCPSVMPSVASSTTTRRPSLIQNISGRLSMLGGLAGSEVEPNVTRKELYRVLDLLWNRRKPPISVGQQFNSSGTAVPGSNTLPQPQPLQKCTPEFQQRYNVDTTIELVLRLRNILPRYERQMKLSNSAVNFSSASLGGGRQQLRKTADPTSGTTNELTTKNELISQSLEYFLVVLADLLSTDCVWVTIHLKDQSSANDRSSAKNISAGTKDMSSVKPTKDTTSRTKQGSTWTQVPENLASCRPTRPPYLLHHAILEIGYGLLDHVLTASNLASLGSLMLMSFDAFPASLYHHILRFYSEGYMPRMLVLAPLASDRVEASIFNISALEEEYQNLPLQNLQINAAAIPSIVIPPQVEIRISEEDTSLQDILLDVPSLPNPPGANISRSSALDQACTNNLLLNKSIQQQTQKLPKIKYSSEIFPCLLMNLFQYQSPPSKDYQHAMEQHHQSSLIRQMLLLRPDVPMDLLEMVALGNNVIRARALQMLLQIWFRSTGHTMETELLLQAPSNDDEKKRFQGLPVATLKKSKSSRVRNKFGLQDLQGGIEFRKISRSHTLYSSSRPCAPPAPMLRHLHVMFSSDHLPVGLSENKI